MTQPDPFIETQTEHPVAETYVLLNLLGIGGDEIANGQFRSAEVVFQELDIIASSSSV
jgi:hypothetical protein